LGGKEVWKGQNAGRTALTQGMPGSCIRKAGRRGVGGWDAHEGRYLPVTSGGWPGGTLRRPGRGIHLTKQN